MTDATAVPPLAALRMAHLLHSQPAQIERTIAQFGRDKGYRQDLLYLPHSPMPRMLSVLTRRHFDSNLGRLRINATYSVAPYRGLPEEIGLIDRALIHNNSGNNFVGEGASAHAIIAPALSSWRHVFSSVSYMPTEPSLPVAIVGAGAAGLIVQEALRRAGFTNLSLFERRPQPAGIWSESSVYDGSRNNPRDLDLFGFSLSRGPGTGKEVRDVLLAATHGRKVFIQSRPVRSITPGNLQHVLEFTDGALSEFPIVINCCGMGLPRPISDKTKMVGPERHVSAVRWQYPRLSVADARSKMFVFIGLGNSTAEMIALLQEFQTAGVDCDYRVLTHYPREAIFNPQETVIHNRKGYRVFRDLTKPDLTSFQGDLEPTRRAYFRALADGKIIPDVVQWDVTNTAGTRVMGIRRRRARRISDFIPFDHLYILTGYRHTAQSLQSFGLSYDPDGLYPHYDYDGEFLRADPRTFSNNAGGARVFKGYFGFGSVLNAPHNKNSIVIPGMLFRISDLLAGVVFRTAEYYASRI